MKKVIGVVGLGSMGRRRIRLLRNHFPEVEIVGIDTNEERCSNVKDEYNIDCFCKIDEAYSKNHVSIVFVCTSPLSHAEVISKCLGLGMHVFTEINLVSTMYDENIKLARDKGLILFLSSTFLYRKETQYIIKSINEFNKKVQYTYHVGQYLPDWHPWENYKNFFVALRETNACREILAIDLPWIIAAFGRITKMNVSSTKASNLDISYDDSYIITLNHENGSHGVITVDIIACSPIREFRAVGEGLQLEWGGEPNEFYEYDVADKQMKPVHTYNQVDKLKGYADYIIEDEYLDEIKAFFLKLEDDTRTCYGFEDDLYTLNIIDEIERLGEC